MLQMNNTGKVGQMLAEIQDVVRAETGRMQAQMDFQTWWCFCHVAANPGASISELLEIMPGYTVAGMSRLVSRLTAGKVRGGTVQGLDLVVRKPDVQDRRIIRVYLSPRGERLLTRIDKIHKRYCQ